MSEGSHAAEVVVMGAWLAGLVAARDLIERGASVVVPVRSGESAAREVAAEL